MVVSLHEIEAGGLQCIVTSPKKDKDCYTFDNPGPDQKGTMWVQDNSKEVIDSLGSRVNSAMTQISGIVNSIGNSLSEEHKLYFPGAGAYIYKYPVISEKGHLMSGLKFNGYVRPWNSTFIFANHTFLEHHRQNILLELKEYRLFHWPTAQVSRMVQFPRGFMGSGATSFQSASNSRTSIHLMCHREIKVKCMYIDVGESITHRSEASSEDI